MNLKNLALAILAAAVAVLLYLQFTADSVPGGVHAESQPAPQVKKVPTVSVQTAPVHAYAPEAKVNLKLPEHVRMDKAKHVVAATRTQADERPHTVTTVLDAATGEVMTYDRAEPLPWIAVRPRTELGAFVGYKFGEPALRIEARQDLMQVKGMHLGAIATADATASGVDGFVGIGVWARW